MKSDGMRFTIVLGQRMSWPDMLSRALKTESLGLDGLYVVDHYFGRVDIMEPTHEAWTMLAALAPFTQRLRLGVMVCGNTYRNPAFLLKQAITVDHISGGRVDFGVGAGWLEREHEAYGFDLPAPRERVDRFAEALQIWDALQHNEFTTFEGKHYSLLDAPFEPKSLQSPRLPLVIGASGKRMLRLVARYADTWNLIATPEEAAIGNLRLDEACREVGRDPATIERSVSPGINLLESPSAFAEGVEAFREAGFTHITFPWPRVEAEVPVLREVARSILPGLRGTVQPEATGKDGIAPRRSMSGADVATLRSILADLGDPAVRFLTYLSAHPGTLHEGALLVDVLRVERHQDVTRTAAAIGELLAKAGLARPWTEAQRGYSLDQDMASIVRTALDD